MSVNDGNGDPIIERWLRGGGFRQFFGWADYNDLATATVPLSVPTGLVWTDVPNDTLGGFTDESELPEGVSSVWNPATGDFDWSELSLGDRVRVRFHCDITTTANNQEVDTAMHLAHGGASPYYVSAGPKLQYKTSGLQEDITMYMGFYMGKKDNGETRDLPAHLRMRSDAACTVKVKGWYVEIDRIGLMVP